jgi:hypothetical protein
MTESQRRIHGAHYTPKYIVDYIAEHTVGKLLSTTPTITNLAILDPACGSGSFLLGAYEHITKQYPNIPKREILLNNIYGVDIDPQAVELTKLVLLLYTIEQGTTPLPDLDSNIKCGNSLIGPDFYAEKQLSLLDEDTQYRINAFDWRAEFPAVMKRGGFDAVIGNPPYLNIDDVWGKGDLRLKYLKNHYKLVYNDKTDILFYFLYQAVLLSKNRVGFIISRAFLESYKADKLRGFLSKRCCVDTLVDFQNYFIFKGVGITTAILSLTVGEKGKPATVYQLIADEFSENMQESLLDSKTFRQIEISPDKLGVDSWTFVESGVEKILEKIDQHGQPIGDILTIGKGMETGRNGVFGKLELSVIEDWGLPKELYYYRASNSSIQRFHIEAPKEVLIFPSRANDFNNLPLAVQNHLSANKNELSQRAAFKRGDCLWWRYTWPLHEEMYNRTRILCPYLAKENRFAIDENDEYLGLTDTTVLFDSGQNENLYYILGLLNSRLLNFRFKYIGKLKSGGVIEYFWNSVSKLPIRPIDFADKKDKARHDKMVELVQAMLELNKRKDTALLIISTDDEHTRQIAAADAQIDALVYELYGLSDEEIKIVEEHT